MAAKKVTKSAGNSATGKPFQKGDDARRGRGPAKGEGGRPSDEIKALCRELSDKHQLAEVLATIATAKDEQTKDRVAAIKLLWAYGHGMPTQHVDVTSRHEDALDLLA